MNMKLNTVPALLLAAILTLEPVAGFMETESGETIPEITSVVTEEALPTTENTELPEQMVSETEAETESEEADTNQTEATQSSELSMPEELPPEICTMPEGVFFSSPAAMMPPVTGTTGVSLFRRSAMGGDNNLILNKTALDNGDGTFTLRLESYAVGTAAVVTQVPVPSDVVLVLDESGSMNDCIECGHEMSEECQRLSQGCLHKVYSSQLDTSKQYRTYYRNSAAEERTVGYCSNCKRWYSDGPYKKCSGHGSLGYWVAFESEGDTHDYNNKVYHTQFYAACDHDTQRMDALKGAVTSFLNRMHSNSLGPDGNAGTGDEIDNRVAIVGFDNDTSARVYTPENGESDGYILADSVAAVKGSLKSMAENKDAVFAGLSQVRVRAATATHRGMEAARMILEGNPVPAGQKRNRVVILFTDGSPGSNYENNENWANSAIGCAHSIKKTYGATVYTVGLFWGADASNPENLPRYDVTANGVNNLQFFRNGNRFLHLVSSNYPDAESLNSTGTVVALENGEGYYLSTDDENGLYSIFGKLSGVVTPGGTSVTLDANSAVKDIITETFEIAEGTRVNAWTESFRGGDTWEKDANSVSNTAGGELTVSVDHNTVTVTGFDFAENYVATDESLENTPVYRGKKLVIQVDISPIAGFLGGDDIETNEPSSAIYARPEDMEPVRRFPQPQVDVKIRQILPETEEKDIYLSQSAELPKLINTGIYSMDGMIHSVDSVKNKYADIIYTLTDPSRNVWKCTIPAGETLENARWEVSEGQSKNLLLKEDTQYSVHCEVVSVNNRANQAEFTGSANIRVFIPEITFRDSGIDLGQVPDYEDNFCSVRWFHGDKTADSGVMGRAPELIFAYSPEATAFRKDTSVAVSVTAKQDDTVRVPMDQDITAWVRFFREGCSEPLCDNPVKSVVDAKDPQRVNYVVHLNTFHLRIEKDGADPVLDPACNFLFRVTGPGGFSLDVVIPGNGFAVLRDLPVGTYYVTELTGWSWRYEPETVTKTVGKQEIQDGFAVVRFYNNRTEEKWLDGETRAENRFGILAEGGEEAAG